MSTVVDLEPISLGNRLVLSCGPGARIHGDGLGSCVHRNQLGSLVQRSQPEGSVYGIWLDTGVCHEPGSIGAGLEIRFTRINLVLGLARNQHPQDLVWRLCLLGPDAMAG